MPALADIQSCFRDAILSGSARGIEGSIVPSELGAEPRLGIYRNNVFSSLIEALGALYPVVKRLVGEEFFSATAREYCQNVPPTHGRMGEYGTAFPDFLLTFEPAAALPYLGDVAALELRWHRAYHAADAHPINGEAFRSIDPAALPRLRLQLHPSHGLIRSDFPIAQIWEVNQPDSEAEEMIDLGSGGDHLLVIRPASNVEVRKLGQGSYAFLDALGRGLSVLEAFETAESLEANFDLQGNLQDFLAGGTFSAIELDEVEKLK